MYHDGKCYIWIPSALTLNKLTAETAALVNAVHTAVGLPAGLGAGDTNPHYLDLNDLDMGGAPFTRDATPGMAVCGPIENLAYLPIPYVQLIAAFSGDVEALPVWFELDAIDVVCPFSDSNETWETWGVFGESHAPRQIGGKWYRSTCVGESGQMLDASEYINSGLTIKTKAEYLAIVAGNGG